MGTGSRTSERMHRGGKAFLKTAHASQRESSFKNCVSTACKMCCLCMEQWISTALQCLNSRKWHSPFHTGSVLNFPLFDTDPWLLKCIWKWCSWHLVVRVTTVTVRKKWVFLYWEEKSAALKWNVGWVSLLSNCIWYHFRGGTVSLTVLFFLWASHWWSAVKNPS